MQRWRWSSIRETGTSTDPMNLSLTLQTVARRTPELPALTWDGGAMSYATLEAEVSCVGGALLRRHGLVAGDRVGLVMENTPEFFASLYGIWRAGLTAVPINAKLHAKELAWIVADSGARLVIATPAIANKLTGLADASVPPLVATGTRDYAALLTGDAIHRSPTDPSHEAWLFYTSGTTGRPKGAVLTHRNLLFMCHCYYADIDRIGPGDTLLHAAPLSHGSGLYALAHIARGSNNLIVAGTFEPERIYDALVRFPNVSMFAAPTMVVRLLTDPRAGSADTRNLKSLIYGGAPMYVADLDRAIGLFGPRLYQLYGQGESPMTITGLDQACHAAASHPRFRERLGSVGVARTGVAVRIVDADSRELPPGEAGEIVTRSDCVMSGYWNQPAADAVSLRDGWLRTGDIGSLDADGFLTLKDRSKDMIISGGANIYPREIEEVLLLHPGVLECAVVGRPHTEWGEEVIAFIVRRPESDRSDHADATSLDRLCLDNIARFKRPKGYRFVEALPKNNYGKVLKTELRQLLAAETRI